MGRRGIVQCQHRSVLYIAYIHLIQILVFLLNNILTVADVDNLEYGVIPDVPIVPIIAQQPQSGALSIENGVLTYAPNFDFFGDDMFLLKFSDGELESDDTVTVNISIENVFICI